MDWQLPPPDPRLTSDQRELLHRLSPLVEQLDAAQVTEQSGLRIVPTGAHASLELRVWPRDDRIAPLHVDADRDACIADYAGGPRLECHSGLLVDDLVDVVGANGQEALSIPEGRQH
jgi:hypothetical protein